MIKAKTVFKVQLIVLLIVIGYIFYLKICFKGWADDITSQKQEILKSSLGDEFIVDLEICNFPDVDTAITVMDSKGKEQITYFVIHSKANKADLQTILDTPQVRCYQYYNELIFKVGNSQFKAVNIDEIPEMKPTEMHEFNKVAKALAAKKEWIWIQSCAKYLFNCGDSDIKNTMERYANGQFTQEELNINQNSKITKEQMEAFAKQILNIVE